jgi:hypothetical protein
MENFKEMPPTLAMVARVVIVKIVLLHLKLLWIAI